MNRAIHYIFILTAIFMQTQLFGQEIPNIELYEPMPLPQYTPPKDPGNQDNKLLIFNMTDNSFDTIEFKNEPREGEHTLPPSGANIPAESFDNGKIAYKFNDLYPADQLAGFPAYPISSVVKLYITMYNPSNGSTSYSSCSGMMINPSFIITAGHCVKSNVDGSYAVACTVVPAYNLGNKPFSQTTTTNWYSFTQWTNNGNWDYDMAILSLSSPIGNNTGWLGWGYNSNNSFFTSPSNDFHIFGYPGQDDFGNPVFEQGNRMYYMNGYMDFWQSSNTMCHYNIGYRGLSGSGLYYKDGSNDRYVLGVLSHGNGKTMPYYTCHCRMDASMFNYFSSVIPGATGMEDVNLTKHIRVFPNPSNGIFTIDLGEISFRELHLKVSNSLGQEIFGFNTADSGTLIPIDLTRYPSGTYFIQSIIDGEVVNGKIIKSE